MVSIGHNSSTILIYYSILPSIKARNLCLFVCMSAPQKAQEPCIKLNLNMAGVLLTTRGCALLTSGAIWIHGPPPKPAILTPVIVATVTAWSHCDTTVWAQRRSCCARSIWERCASFCEQMVLQNAKKGHGRKVTETKGFDQSISNRHTSRSYREDVLCRSGVPKLFSPWPSKITVPETGDPRQPWRWHITLCTATHMQH